jgi:hypothetical protein
MMYPAFLAQLAHQYIDLREARPASFPALEALFCLFGADVVFACCLASRMVHLGG